MTQKTSEQLRNNFWKEDIENGGGDIQSIRRSKTSIE